MYALKQFLTQTQSLCISMNLYIVRISILIWLTFTLKISAFMSITFLCTYSPQNPTIHHRIKMCKSISFSSSLMTHVSLMYSSFFWSTNTALPWYPFYVKFKSSVQQVELPEAHTGNLQKGRKASPSVFQTRV